MTPKPWQPGDTGYIQLENTPGQLDWYRVTVKAIIRDYDRPGGIGLEVTIHDPAGDWDNLYAAEFVKREATHD